MARPPNLTHGASMKKTRLKKERMMVMGALMASAAVGAPAAMASPVSPAHKSRYEEAMAEVLKTMRWAQASGTTSQAPATRRFDIPAGPLQTVLAAFHAETG